MFQFEQTDIWFITGSQHLYGPEVLDQVARHAAEIAAYIGASSAIPSKVVYQPVVKTPDEIYAVCQAANLDSRCIGVVVWMHTFSPAKMWIRGLQALQKPLCHFHTQYNRDIPWDAIDMDFMNLNQSAHGDREFGHIASRLGLARKVVVGHWKDQAALDQMGVWVRAAAARHDWQGARFVRFGDNMRQVAVTEGDKVEAEMRFGYSVNTHGIGDLVARIQQVHPDEVDHLVETYLSEYEVVTSLLPGGVAHPSLREAARIEAGMRSFLQEGNFKGFTDTFEDLHGLAQLPGIASQRLMAEGYGFGAEGDWKTAALVRAAKVMGSGLPGGNSFMEDYTYHLDPSNPMVLGAHMLEICPSIAQDRPRCEIHPLGIGGKADPVRLVFRAGGGSALNASMVDMGNRFRLLVNTVDGVAPEHALPKLPVASVLWKPHPDFQTGCAAWIYAGGAHHTVYSQNLSVAHFEDFAEMFGIELAVIDQTTSLRQFRTELRLGEWLYNRKGAL
ncbi:MAG: L-arabinose isomerase [Haliscomenobacter sp.]